jgi:exosome complex exonuclease DIS3/RRP44
MQSDGRGNAIVNEFGSVVDPSMKQTIEIRQNDPHALGTANARYKRHAFFRSSGTGSRGRKRSRGLKLIGAGGVGRIAKTVSEQYVRDDLGFGCYFVNSVDEGVDKRRANDEGAVVKPRVITDVEHLLSVLVPSSYANPTISSVAATNVSMEIKTHHGVEVVILDTNVLLHNMDVVIRASSLLVLPNVVIPHTALMECRAQQRLAYDRCVDLLRSSAVKVVPTANGSYRHVSHNRCAIFFSDPFHVETASDTSANFMNNNINDENDARIRHVAAFFGSQLANTNVNVVLLTDDAESRRLAKEQQGKDGVKVFDAYSVAHYVKVLEQRCPGLLLSDHIAQYSGSTERVETALKSESQFSEHVDSVRLFRGLRHGQYYRGVYRSSHGTSVCSVTNPSFVTIRRGDERVIVSLTSAFDANRAVDGDEVAIALKPLEEWLPSVSFKNDARTVSAKTTSLVRGDAPSIVSATAEPTLSELSNVPETMLVPQNGSNTDLRPTGQVVGIIRRSFQNQVGTIWTSTMSSLSRQAKQDMEREKIVSNNEVEHEDGSSTCVFFPVDTKIPPVLIRTTQRDKLVSQRIVVALDAWPSTSPFPRGHFVRTIGPVGSKDVETEVLLQEFDIPHEPFPASVLACLPPTDYTIAVNNCPERVDLRRLPILSIDPPNCQDIDDALHCIKLPNGHYQVG